METGFTFSDIYDETVSRAGGEQTTAEDVVRVRRGLRMLLERWEAKGFNTWRIRSMKVQASGAQKFVQLPVRVDDVIHVTPEGGGALQRVPADRYMTMGGRETKGRAASWWLAREEPPKLYLHPSGNGETLEVWYVQRPEHYDAVNSNMDDIPGRWMEALILGLAHDFARKRPGPGGVYDEPLIARLRGESAEAEGIAERADRDRARYRYRVS